MRQPVDITHPFCFLLLPLSTTTTPFSILACPTTAAFVTHRRAPLSKCCSMTARAGSTRVAMASRATCQSRTCKCRFSRRCVRSKPSPDAGRHTRAARRPSNRPNRMTLKFEIQRTFKLSPSTSPRMWGWVWTRARVRTRVRHDTQRDVYKFADKSCVRARY